ncbi:hypothetical protein [uncultured Deinococcus sp.]|uniref:hypothetical protein n=1 Tax=uncultured Deinococcus sp. TaxID=158789 RepID=UPI002582830F|nr:hypothetical protein [uncultured Deinococcus sp.]
MASLPCEACQEETTVIPTGIILEDSMGALACRRFRVCTTPECELYLIRRESLEQFLPISPDMWIMNASHGQLSKNREIADRVAPFPFHLVPETYWEKISKHPPFSSDEQRVVKLAALHRFLTADLVEAELQIPLKEAKSILLRLWRIGIFRKGASFLIFELIPNKYLPANIRLLTELQRSAS